MRSNSNTRIILKTPNNKYASSLRCVIFVVQIIIIITILKLKTRKLLSSPLHGSIYQRKAKFFLCLKLSKTQWSSSVQSLGRVSCVVEPRVAFSLSLGRCSVVKEMSRRGNNLYEIQNRKWKSSHYNLSQL